MMNKLAFDPFARELRTDPHAWYRRFREEEPVHRSARHGWLLTRYRDCDRLMRDERSVVKDPQRSLALYPEGPFRDHNRANMNFMTAEDHRRVRGPFNRYFSARSVASFESRVRAIVDDVIAELEGRGTFDLMSDFAFSIPVYVVCDLLGIESRDRERFKHWSMDVVAGLDLNGGPEDKARAARAVSEFTPFFHDLILDRMKRPREDLLTLIAEAHEAGTLSMDEAIHQGAFILNAGHETTTHLIGNGMQALFEHPEAMGRLKQDPDTAAPAVEEFLRWDPPIHFVRRFAARNLHIDGHTIAEGEVVMFGIAAANRDPEEFSEPDTFDITRPVRQNRHLSFVVGAYRCLGAELARLEGRIAFQRLLARFPGLRPEGPPVRKISVIFQGFDSLPVAT